MNSGIPYDKSLLTPPLDSNLNDLDDFLDNCNDLVDNGFLPSDELSRLVLMLNSVEFTSLNATDNVVTIDTHVDKAQSYCTTTLKTANEDLKKIQIWKSSDDNMDKILSPISICVSSLHVKDAMRRISENKINENMENLNIISVAGGFPMGLAPMSSRLCEVEWAITHGATGIDLVIDRRLVLMGKFKKLYTEVNTVKKMTGSTIMLKTILSVSELCTNRNIYKAAMVAMMAGSDFIVTSTGKEAENATLNHGLIMFTAIKTYYEKTKFKVGLKLAGDSLCHKEVFKWFMLFQYKLGSTWSITELFRIGTYTLFPILVERLRIVMESLK